MWQLVINGPGYFETAYDVPSGATHLGRADENEIVLSGDLVSRRHSRFVCDEQTLRYEDLGSRNGSKLNGEPIAGQVTLSSGDVLVIGENTIQIRRALGPSDSLVTESAVPVVRRVPSESHRDLPILLMKDMRESTVRRFLDNVAPFSKDEAPPVPARVRRIKQDDLQELKSVDPEIITGETELPNDGPTESPEAWNSLLLLYRVVERLAVSQSQQGFFDEACDLMMARVQGNTAVLLLRQHDGRLSPAAVRHSGPLKRGEVPVSDAIIETALNRGQAIAVADVRDDSRFASRESVVLYGVDQVICVPLGNEAPFLGVLYVNRSSRDGEPIEAMLDVCAAVAHLMVQALQKFRDGSTHEARLRHLLERHHSHPVVEKTLPEVVKTAGRGLQEQMTTVVSLKLEGLVALQKTAPLAVVSAVVAEFQKLATKAFFSFDGALIRVEADAVLAVFGTPIIRADDAVRALRASLAFRAEWASIMSHRPVNERLLVHGGIHSGKVMLGHLGSESRLDFFVAGENVEIATALTQACQSEQLLISGKTLAMVGARFECTPMGERVLPGLKLKLPVFELLEEDNESGTLSGVR